jgi:hypothetical protein
LKYFEELLVLKNFIEINPRDISSNVKRSYEEGILKLSKSRQLNRKSFLRKHIEEETSRNLLVYDCLNNKLLSYGLVYAKKS